jgi:5'-AMP-activated protein kinase, regulatory gamma subunit
MAAGDYIHALRIWRAQKLAGADLASRTIAEMMLSAGVVFQHATFEAVDAEDSVLQMCSLLLRTDNDYVPVVDADNGNLVSILGFLDVVHLLGQAAQQCPALFAKTVKDANIGTFSNIVTAPKTARLCDVLDVIELKNLSGLPVVDEENKVVNFYFRSDVAFILRAPDTDTVIGNLSSMTVEQSIVLREQMLQCGDIMSAFQGLVTCRMTDTLSTVLTLMLRGRSCRVVIVNELQQCVGLISIRDIIRFYADTDTFR